MKLATIVTERLQQLKLFASQPGSAEEMVDEFAQAWRELGCQIIQQQLQEQLESAESKHSGSRQRRSKHYHTPLGTITLTRRVYGSKGGQCLGDQSLELPSNGWFRSVEELSCGLGVTSEFAHANRLLTRWSGIELSEKTLANHVEQLGLELIESGVDAGGEGICPVVSSVSAATVPSPERPIFYVGADGIHTPMRQGGTQEAKVGVMFWASEHWQLSKTRAMIRQREYVATLDKVSDFRERLNRCYAQTVKDYPHQVVFLGDGAPWIWLMANLLFPDSIQILDFFHVSEYLWEVARSAFVDQDNHQKEWVDTQQDALKHSQWQAVVRAAQRLPPGARNLPEKVSRLVSYLTNNQTRIDYQAYLAQGLMIGSGVVESSNRRIVTVRLKQSGMFWSTKGAEAVMQLRACYLSSSNRWQNFWSKCT